MPSRVAGSTSLKLSHKLVTIFLIVSVVLAVGVFAAPFLGCFYRSHQFEACVRFQIEAADCRKTISGRSTEDGQCFLALEGIRSKDGIQFVGSGLSYLYDSAHRIFKVEGEGEIKSGRNSIEIHSGHIFINGQQLPVRSTPLRVLVKEDGRLVNEFCDVG